MTTNIITIRPIENREHHFFASFKDEFLNCVYSVTFSDSITGALAVNRFFLMIDTLYKGRNTHLQLSSRKVTFKSKAILDALTGKMEVNQ